MSADTGDRPHEATVAECAAWRRRARDGATGREIASDARFVRPTVDSHVRNRKACSHATAAETGVEPLPPKQNRGAPADPAEFERRVAAAIGAALAANVGDTVGVRVATLTRRYPDRLDGCARHHVGGALRALAERGTIETDACAFSVACATPGANRATWTARRVEGGER